MKNLDRGISWRLFRKAWQFSEETPQQTWRINDLKKLSRRNNKGRETQKAEKREMKTEKQNQTNVGLSLTLNLLWSKVSW